MANGEKELEVGKEDRPPTLASPSSSPTNIKLKKLFSPEDPLSKEPSKSLSVNNDDLLEQLKVQEQSAEFAIDDDDPTNEKQQHQQQQQNLEGDPNEKHDPETNEEGVNEIQNAFIKEDHYTSESVKYLHASPSPVTEPKTKQLRYFHGKPVISCLKVKHSVSNEPSAKNENIPKKGVHFPEEDDYVMEFIDPVDPWRDVRTPSKVEVISFYRNSCQKQRSKPNEKVIKQIQDITDMSGRANTLVLRGSRLDNRSCEALESIFRRVQFENLDLENCNLEEDGATSLLEMIEFYHSTCKLNIACNPKIGMRGWQALCRMLRKTPCLTYLDARRTLLTDMTMPTFGRCLKADPPLKILHLEGVFLSGRPMLILTTAMKYNKILEELYLGDNDLSSSDGSPIGAMLTYNTSLQLLDLRNNQIKDVGLAHICNGLSDQSEQNFGGLCSLILWNNGLTHEGMTYLSEGLVHTTSLKALNLGHNRIGDLGIQKLKIGLIKNKSLHKLGFLNTKLGSEGAVALAEVLADSLSITRIDIRENNIQTAGLMAFSMALKVNHSLLRLDLDKDIRKEQGMEQVMQTVLVDIYNFCHRNKQLARQNLNSGSSVSSEFSQIIRQASTESNEYGDCHIITEDVFHPEGDKQTVTPFSPVYTDQNAMMKFPLNFKDDSNEPRDGSRPMPTPNSAQIPQPATEQELINAISSSPLSVPKDIQSVHILNKPPLNSSERRSSNRFSITKILDTVGNHVAGVGNKIVNVANMDNKLKKQAPKDDISKVIESKDVISEGSLIAKKSVESAELKKEINCGEGKVTSESEEMTLPDGSLNSPIEIIDFSESEPVFPSIKNVGEEASAGSSDKSTERQTTLSREENVSVVGNTGEVLQNETSEIQSFQTPYNENELHKKIVTKNQTIPVDLPS